MSKVNYKDKYEEYKNANSAFKFELENYQKQYDGKLMPEKGKETACIYNFTKELIESELDISVPSPKVEATIYSDKGSKRSKIIEAMLKGEMKKLKIDLFNDIDERNTKIYGGNIALIDWDNTLKTHFSVGAVGIKSITPTRFVPQPKIDAPEKMDCIYVDFDVTKREILKKYNKDVSGENVDDSSDTSNDSVTQHYCFYKNSKGYIGCYSWVGDTVLIDEEFYNARQIKVCEKCGATKPADNSKCACGSDKWVKRNPKFEELTEDKDTLFNHIPAMDYARENGEYLTTPIEVPVMESNPYTGQLEPLYDRVFDESMNIIGEKPQTTIEDRPYMEPTKIPYYTPKGFPVLVRKNVSHVGMVLGDSDCDFIQKLQREADKRATRMIEKLNKEGSILVKPRDLSYEPSNTEQVIEIDSVDQMAMLGVKDLRFDTSQSVGMINQFYIWAKSELGINDSAQGKADSTALSGAAKEAQISRALGRQESKVKMKNAFYSDIYRKIFEHMLAYADEPRKYTTVDELGDSSEIVFDRYDFLDQDEFGNWYYDDQFIFSVDASGGANENRQYVLDTMQKDFLGGLYGDVANPETLYNLWKDRAEQGYPNAERQVARWKIKVDEYKKMQAMMSQIPQDVGTQTDQATTQQQAVNSVTGQAFGDLGGK